MKLSLNALNSDWKLRSVLCEMYCYCAVKFIHALPEKHPVKESNLVGVCSSGNGRQDEIMKQSEASI